MRPEDPDARSSSVPSLSSMTGVSIINLVKKFGSTVAVAGVDLWIESGSLFFLLGPSGCGKTTLLRMIAGFETPNSGMIRFGDREVTKHPPEKRDAGMVFQGYALWPHLSVFENVAFGLRVRKVPNADLQRRVGEALELVQMNGYEDRKPTQLSGGQQQRVALARALAFRPSVLLLDEPLSNLDAKLRLEMRSEIRRIVDDAQITTIYVTHDQEEALSLADQMAVLRDGKVIQTGGPRELYDQPNSRFTASFLGETNFVEGTVESVDREGTTVSTPLGNLRSNRTLEQAAIGDTISLSLRPEALRVIDPENSATNPPSGWNRASTAVTRSMFLGETAQLELRGDGDTSLKVLELHPRVVRSAGSPLDVAIDPADVVLLSE